MTFSTQEQSWSPGLFRIPGLEAGAVRPDDELMLSLVPSDDRAVLEGSAEIVRTSLLGDRAVRITRRDATMRLVMSRGGVFHSADGEPVRSRRDAVAALRAAGIDVFRMAGEAVATAKVG
ncbi:PAS domain-containing protein [Methylobacterium planeticum]|uniref:PAS domain-containing protein n=1 Tax=Methylobacterium planeticum TaxID=2615211 RepID=A0A6N6MJ79_9HYPH|nr:PAS domain-containing protein [Methylobacterium planeticum]KAB1069609.1 PAS domain-containing protein [Methylobacterium planeticum]